MISLETANWKIENIETILFDKDGTFIDLHYFWGKMTELRCKEIICKFNLNAEYFNELCLCLGYDLSSEKMLSNGITALYSRSKIIEIFKNDLKKVNVFTTDEELAEIFDDVSKKFYKNMVEYTKPINSAISFINAAKQNGAKLGIVTSDSVESTHLTLKHFHWEKLFDCVVGRESSTKTKESGALVKIALSELNANPKTTVMIGDAPMDYQAAKNAGVEKTILVATGQLTVSELENISNYSIKTLNDLHISPST